MISIQVEEDIFGSDFESTDEEAEKVVGEAGENEIIDEERRIRKVDANNRLLCMLIERSLVRQPEVDWKKLLLLLMPNTRVHLILTFKYPLPSKPSRSLNIVNESH